MPVRVVHRSGEDHRVCTGCVLQVRRNLHRGRELGEDVHAVPSAYLDLLFPGDLRPGEIKRRTDVVGIFPNEAAVMRLAGAVLLEIHDEWAVAERRYLAEGSMALLDRAGDDGLTKEVDRADNLLLAS